MVIRKLRIQRAWSQEQLAEFSGLSIRTVQRVEQGQAASLETLKSLAAVFEVSIGDLHPETSQVDSNTSAKNDSVAFNTVNVRVATTTLEERQAFFHVKKLRKFYKHALIYTAVIVGLIVINTLTSPNHWWVLYTAISWGIGLSVHAASVFSPISIFGPAWEKREIEKLLGRKL